MPKAILSRRATFAASHRLHSDSLSDQENEALFGKCNRANGHGHNYVMEVLIKSEIDPNTGLIMNLVDLKSIIEKTILDEVDHKHLNHDVEWLKGTNPTTENLVVAFWERLEKVLPQGFLHEIKLHETENNIAIYRGE